MCGCVRVLLQLEQPVQILVRVQDFLRVVQRQISLSICLLDESNPMSKTIKHLQPPLKRLILRLPPKITLLPQLLHIISHRQITNHRKTNPQHQLRHRHRHCLFHTIRYKASRSNLQAGANYTCDIPDFVKEDAREEGKSCTR